MSHEPLPLPGISTVIAGRLVGLVGRVIVGVAAEPHARRELPVARRKHTLTFQQTR